MTPILPLAPGAQDVGGGQHLGSRSRGWRAAARPRGRSRGRVLERLHVAGDIAERDVDRVHAGGAGVGEDARLDRPRDVRWIAPALRARWGC